VEKVKNEKLQNEWFCKKQQYDRQIETYKSAIKDACALHASISKQLNLEFEHGK
jgi:hypothetical protein